MASDTWLARARAWQQCIFHLFRRSTVTRTTTLYPIHRILLRVINAKFAWIMNRLINYSTIILRMYLFCILSYKPSQSEILSACRRTTKHSSYISWNMNRITWNGDSIFVRCDLANQYFRNENHKYSFLQIGHVLSFCHCIRHEFSDSIYNWKWKYFNKEAFRFDCLLHNSIGF